jgi:hypothetical protein
MSRPLSLLLRSACCDTEELRSKRAVAGCR